MQSLFMLDRVGNAYIEKHWRGMLSRTVCDMFWADLQKEEGGELPPIIATPKHYLAHVVRDNTYFLAVLNDEIPPLLIIEFLHRLSNVITLMDDCGDNDALAHTCCHSQADVLADYFGSCADDALKENFITIYQVTCSIRTVDHDQLLDEMVDNGYPNITEPVILKEMVMPPSLLNQAMQSMGASSGVSENLPGSTLGSIPWRKHGIKHGSNEVYFDVVEEIDNLIDSNGSILSSEVFGQIQVNCRLSGMPDISMKFVSPKMIDDMALHPCVRYNHYMQSKSLSFVPPDGKFKLCSFKVTPNQPVQIPIIVKPQVTMSGSSGKLDITIRSHHTDKAIEGVVCTVPFPKYVTSVSCSSPVGTVDYDDATKTLKWNLDRLPRDKNPVLTGTFTMPSDKDVVEKPVVQLDFRIIQYSATGLKVDSVSITGEKYKAFKGVRNITRAGKFQIRT